MLVIQKDTSGNILHVQVLAALSQGVVEVNTDIDWTIFSKLLKERAGKTIRESEIPWLVEEQYQIIATNGDVFSWPVDDVVVFQDGEINEAVVAELIKNPVGDKYKINPQGKIISNPDSPAEKVYRVSDDGTTYDPTPINDKDKEKLKHSAASSGETVK